MANLDQKYFRFRQDGPGSGDPNAVWLGAEDTDIAFGVDATFRIRFGIQNDATARNNVTTQLEYRVDGGSWANVNGSSSHVRSTASAVRSDATHCGTTYFAGLTGTKDTTNAGFDSADGASGGNQQDIVSNGNVEVEYNLVLRSEDLSGGEVIDLRVNGLEAYTISHASVTAIVPVIVALDPAEATLAATQIEVSSGVRVSLTQAGVRVFPAFDGLHVTAPSITVASGVTLALLPAALSLSATDVGVSSGVTLDLLPASLALSVPSAEVLAGVALDLDPASISASAPDVAASAGVTLDLDPASVTLSAPSIEVEASGAVSLDLLPVGVALSAVDVEVAVGVALELLPAGVTVTAPPLAVSAGAFVELLPCAVLLTAPDLAVFIGGGPVLLDLDPVAIALYAPPLEVAIGGAEPAHPAPVPFSVERPLAEIVLRVADGRA